MTVERAQTYVDVGSARIGSGGVVRTFSAFLGATVSLQAGGTEWVVRQAPELAVVVDGARLSCMELGGASWSEEANTHAALLIAEFDAGGLVVQVRTWALHEAPALLRVVSVQNFTAAPVALSGVVVDALPLRDAVLRTGSDFADRAASYAGPAAPVALAGPDGGLVLGMEAEGTFALRTEDPALCVMAAPGAWTLAPGAGWSSPMGWMVAYDGGSPGPALGAFRLALRAMRTWEAAQAAARAAESRLN
jgi:hypothetical protein